jgi:hypothetical protein
MNQKMVILDSFCEGSHELFLQMMKSIFEDITKFHMFTLSGAKV